jgi:ATP-dependent Clp protease ATP-binding subunit ClpA
MFERFTEGARQGVVMAQEEARRLKHDRIGRGHLLLGIMREEDGVGSRVLLSLGLTIEQVRAVFVALVPVGPRGDEEMRGQIPFTPGAKRALEFSLREALAMGHGYIGTEHTLLGLLQEADRTEGGDTLPGGEPNMVYEILEKCEVSPQAVRSEVEKVLGVRARDPLRKQRVEQQLGFVAVDAEMVLQEFLPGATVKPAFSIDIAVPRGTSQEAIDGVVERLETQGWKKVKYNASTRVIKAA